MLEIYIYRFSLNSTWTVCSTFRNAARELTTQSYPGLGCQGKQKRQKGLHFVSTATKGNCALRPLLVPTMPDGPGKAAARVGSDETGEGGRRGRGSCRTGTCWTLFPLLPPPSPFLLLGLETAVGWHRSTKTYWVVEQAAYRRVRGNNAPFPSVATWFHHHHPRLDTAPKRTILLLKT